MPLKRKSRFQKAHSKRTSGRNSANRRAARRPASPAAPRAFNFNQPGDSLGVRYDNFLQAASLVTAGLPTAAVARLQRTSGLTQERIQQVAGISKGSFARRKLSGRLSRDESERLLRLSRLFERAAALHDGDPAGATEWLETPIPALGNQRPLDLARTEPGAREVEDLIGRIEHGVVS